MAPEKKQVHVWLAVDVLTEVDRFADEHGISRSAAISVLLTQAVGRTGTE